MSRLQLNLLSLSAALPNHSTNKMTSEVPEVQKTQPNLQFLQHTATKAGKKKKSTDVRETEGQNDSGVTSESWVRQLHVGKARSLTVDNQMMGLSSEINGSVSKRRDAHLALVSSHQHRDLFAHRRADAAGQERNEAQQFDGVSPGFRRSIPIPEFTKKQVKSWQQCQTQDAGAKHATVTKRRVPSKHT